MWFYQNNKRDSKIIMKQIAIFDIELVLNSYNLSSRGECYDPVVRGCINSGSIPRERRIPQLHDEARGQ